MDGRDLRTAVLTDAGRERSNNEDAVLANGSLLAVADGVGGEANGEQASALAIQGLLALGPDPDPAAVPRAFAAINDELRSRNAEAGTSMGTTCTAMVVRDGRAHVTHIGDSRAYLLRNDALTRLTTDHALLTQLVAAGLMTEEQASRDDRRNVILRALGSASHVELDHFSVPLLDGDRVLLATDGLHGYVDDAAIRDTLAAAASAGPAAADLVALANAAGGHDNIGVVVADYGPAAPMPEPAAPMSDPEPVVDAHESAPADDAPAWEAPPAPPPVLEGVPAHPSRIPLVIAAVAAIVLVGVIIVTLVLASSAGAATG